MAKEISKCDKLVIKMVKESIKYDSIIKEIPEEVTLFKEVVVFNMYTNKNMGIESIMFYGESGRLYFYALQAVLSKDEMEILEIQTEAIKELKWITI